MKIHVVGAELLLADGRTDRRNTDRRTGMTKLLVAFRNFANAPKNCHIVSMRVLIKDFPLHLVDLTFSVLPPEANVSHSCVALIPKLRAVVPKRILNCWSWTKSDVTYVVTPTYVTRWLYCSSLESCISEGQAAAPSL